MKKPKEDFFIPISKTVILLILVLGGFFVCRSAKAVDITTDVIWAKAQSPVIINETVSIKPEGSLTIESGVVVKFNPGVYFFVSGALNAEGAKDEPVVFTSIKDDEYGGDSNNDGNSSEPQPGDWEYMYFGYNLEGILNNVIISYGGSSYYGGVIKNRRGKLIITNSKITSNAGGIENSEGDTTISNSSIYNNLVPFIGGIFVDASIDNNSREDIIVNAINNWWGTIEGPCPWKDLIPPDVPIWNVDIVELCGDKPLVDLGVVYDPWLTGEPTQEPPEPDPVIIIPGIMGSWFDDENGWELDPILGVYDNLYKALVENGGYIPEETLFKFPYEWRQDNTLSAYQLKQKIDEVKGICQCEKVDIVAHSMGGLVTRYYIESDNYESDIDQLVFLGTPHRGSPKSYLTWEGADGFDSPKEKIIKLYFNLEAHARGYETLFDYIQDYVKSVEQLLPDYAYLQDVGEIGLREYDEINYPNNYPYNTFLESLNSEENINKLAESGINIFNIIGDTGDNTIGVIKLSSGEQYWPMWMHGYREEVIRLAGDDTVPDVSSSLFIPTKIVGADHLWLTSKAQKEVIEYLTGTLPTIDITDTPEPEEVLVVSVYSPVDFVVISPDGKKIGKDFASSSNINELANAFYSGFESETEFAVIVNPDNGEYKVELQGVGNGTYKLGVDIFDNSSSDEQGESLIPGVISAGDIENFSFNYSASSSEPAVEIQKEISPESLLKDLDELYAAGEISKKYYKKLKKRFKHLAKKYDKIKEDDDEEEDEEREDDDDDTSAGSAQEDEKNEKVNELKHYLNKINKKLKKYLKKGKITQSAYDILTNNINYLIKIYEH